MNRQTDTLIQNEITVQLVVHRQGNVLEEIKVMYCACSCEDEPTDKVKVSNYIRCLTFSEVGFNSTVDAVL